MRFLGFSVRLKIWFCSDHIICVLLLFYLQHTPILDDFKDEFKLKIKEK